MGQICPHRWRWRWWGVQSYLQGGPGGPCPSLGQLQEQGAGGLGRRGSAPHAAPADSSEGSAFSKQWSYYVSASAVILGLKALWVRNLPLRERGKKHNKWLLPEDFVFSPKSRVVLKASNHHVCKSWIPR